LMPKYHYQCEDCEHSYEAWHSLMAEMPHCPKCKSGMIKKVPAFFVVKKANVEYVEEKKVGELTKETIEKNKKSLKQLKDESRKDL